METNKLIRSNANWDMKRCFLPEEIIAEILPRLPVESVLKCRRVCKTWRTLTYHPSFAHLQLLRSLQLDNDDDDDQKYYAAVRSKEGLLYSFAGIDEKTGLHYLEYDRQDGSYKKIAKMNYPPSDCTIVGSCNGLICFSKYHKGIEDSVYICNPITREYIELPTFTKTDDDRLYTLTFGFGYHRKANEYRVVRMSYPGFDITGQVQVYTLGSGCGWRNKGEITYRCQSECYVANGALHWHAVYGHIVSFNLADENFCLLPYSSPPICIDDDYEYNVLGGLFCAIHYVADGSVNIWSFNSSMKEKNYQSGSWNLVFNIKLEGNITNITRLSEQFPLTMSGEVLSCYFKRLLSLGNLKTAVQKKLENPLYWPISETLPHMNSFTSLKSLGEDAKIFKSAEELVESESK